MDEMGKISSLKAVIKRLEGHFNAIVGSLWDIVAGLGHLEMAT